MTAKELAQKLDGRDYMGMDLLTSENQAEAEKFGLVIAYGCSDDLLEFEGAIWDDFGAYEGRTFLIENGRPMPVDENCDNMKKATEITAVWHDEGFPCWTIETVIPHETFNLYEEGKLFSVGIVFDIADTILDRSQWEGCDYCADDDCPLLDYKYCPMCGKPMTEAAWKELERRIANDGN